MTLRTTTFALGCIAPLLLIACSSSSDAGGGSSASGGAAGSASGGSAGALATGGSAGSIGSDTWESYAKGFFASYCIECHGAGNATRDYTTLADVMRDKDTIRCGVSSVLESGCSGFPPPSQFPIDNATHSNPKPGDDERARLVAWIEAGLP